MDICGSLMDIYDSLMDIYDLKNKYLYLRFVLGFSQKWSSMSHKLDRWNKDGASYYYLSLNSYYNGKTQWTFTCHSCHSIHTKKHRTSQNRFVRRIILIGSKTNDYFSIFDQI